MTGQVRLKTLVEEWIRAGSLDQVSHLLQQGVQLQIVLNDASRNIIEFDGKIIDIENAGFTAFQGKVDFEWESEPQILIANDSTTKLLEDELPGVIELGTGEAIHMIRQI